MKGTGWDERMTLRVDLGCNANGAREFEGWLSCKDRIGKSRSNALGRIIKGYKVIRMGVELPSKMRSRHTPSNLHLCCASTYVHFHPDLE